MKLTPAVNFTNILRAAFDPNFLSPKITHPKSNHITAAQNNFVQKRCLLNVGETDPRQQTQGKARIKKKKDDLWKFESKNKKCPPRHRTSSRNEISYDHPSSSYKYFEANLCLYNSHSPHSFYEWFAPQFCNANIQRC